MKKTLSLIALLVMAMTTFAQTFTDKSTVSVGGESSDWPEAQLEVTANGDGSYNVLFKDVTNISGNYTDKYGDVGFSNLTATTENGITTLVGENLTATTFTGVGSGYIPANAVIENANVSVKFNADKAYATLNAKYKYYTGGVGSSFIVTYGTDEFATPEPPVTGGTKLIEDNVTPGGTVISPVAFNINWDKQKLVAKLDMSTCSTTVNENTFSISTNQTDLGEWNQSTGSTLHLYYIKDGETWEATGWTSWTKTLKVQYRTAGSSATVTYSKQVADDANVVVEMKKEGLYIDDELVFPAAEMPGLYADTENSLFFGSIQGENRSYATYKSVEIVNLENGGTDPDPDPEPQPTVYTDKAHTTYWGEFEYTDKVVNIYDLGENKYKVVYNGYNLGTSTLFDLVFNNVEGTTDEDGYTTYTFSGNAITENVQIDPGVIASVNEGGEVEATFNGKSKDGKLYATLTISPMGSTATTVYGTDFTEVVPPTPEPEVTIVSTESFTGRLSATQYALNATDTDVTRSEEEFTIDFNTMSDGTAQVVLKDFPMSDTEKQNLVFNCSSISITKSDAGNDIYSFNDSECVIDGVKCGLFGKANKSAEDGSLYWQFTIGQNEGSYYDLYGCVFNNKKVDGVNAINADVEAEAVEYYTIGGAKVNGLKKGINIVRLANGKTVKVIK